MRKYIIGLVVITAAITSCLKSKEREDICTSYDPCSFTVPTSEITQVENYLDSKGITGAVRHCSGMYYKIKTEGSGAAPGVCSFITINYKGTLANGTIFDSTKTGMPASFYLVNLIGGWKNALPLLKNNGSIQLFIPPSLGYGSTSSAKVPANSLLIFDIELLNVQ